MRNGGKIPSRWSTTNSEQEPAWETEGSMKPSRKKSRNKIQTNQTRRGNLRWEQKERTNHAGGNKQEPGMGPDSNQDGDQMTQSSAATVAVSV